MAKFRPDRLIKESLGTKNLDERVEAIRRDGLYGSPSSHRTFALWGMGLDKPKETAENVIVFGCFPPFANQKDIQAYFKLLDRLGIEYTWLEDENCCGSPVLDRSVDPQSERRELALETARESIGKSIAGARERQAKRMVHMCVWCTYIGKMLFPDDEIAQVHLQEILLDRLATEDLKVEPTTIGYFEGCHVQGHFLTPGVKINYAPFRELMGTVKGLEIVDLPKHLCCVTEMDTIVEEVEKRNLKTVISPCTSCTIRLRRALTGKAEVKSPQAILLEGLG